MAVQVGDTVRLTARALDASGRPVKDVSVRWFQSGGHFEGRVDSTGLVTGGSTGTLNLSALVSPRAGGTPATGFARVTVLPQPAAKLVLDREVARLYVGQSLLVGATPYAANDDRRYDQVLWKLGCAPGGGGESGWTIECRAPRARHDYGPRRPRRQGLHHRR